MLNSILRAAAVVALTCFAATGAMAQSVNITDRFTLSEVNISVIQDRRDGHVTSTFITVNNCDANTFGSHSVTHGTVTIASSRCAPTDEVSGAAELTVEALLMALDERGLGLDMTDNTAGSTEGMRRLLAEAYRRFTPTN